MTPLSIDTEVAVIGAGLAGLTCAQQLRNAGYRVVVFEKSRGVGGRLATRRLHGTLADHGTCYVTPKAPEFQAFIAQLTAAGVVQIWTETTHTLVAQHAGILTAEAPVPRYVAPTGMTAIAKFLATDLDIRLTQRVQTLAPRASHGWHLTAVNPTEDTAVTAVTAQAIVIAIPAPQALLLLQPLASLLPDLWQAVQSVTFLPCLSVMAGYGAERQQDWHAHYPDVRAITVVNDDTLAWVGLDSSKRQTPLQPVFVVQSTAAFAAQHLDTIDLQLAGSQMLERAADRLLVSWLGKPEWLQTHRWRYAFAQPLNQLFLAAHTPVPLLCAGDWCGGFKVEQAYLSGLAVASELDRALQNSKSP